MRRDGYTGFKFYQALDPQDVVDGAALTGYEINSKGYETLTFAVNVGRNTSAGAFSTDNEIRIMMEHAHDDGTGLAGSTWSEVYPSQMINSTYGDDGAYSALNSGTFLVINSVGGFGSTVYAVGYKGPRQWVRVRTSGVGLPSVYSLGIIAILGQPNNWPVNSPS